MTWRNEQGESKNKDRTPRIGSIVSYVLVLLAFISVVSTLQIGYSLIHTRGCTPSEASRMAWLWFAHGPIWLVGAAFLWVAARMLITRLR